METGKIYILPYVKIHLEGSVAFSTIIKVFHKGTFNL